MFRRRSGGALDHSGKKQYAGVSDSEGKERDWPDRRTVSRVGVDKELEAQVPDGVQLLVEWEAPSIDLDVLYGGDGGRPITQYLVEWDTDFANPPSSQYALVSGSTRSFVIGSRNILTG